MRVGLLKKILLGSLALLLFIELMIPKTILAEPVSDTPVSTIEIHGNLASNGIYYGNTQFTLSATDSDGISKIQYKLSSTGSWQTYSQPVNLVQGKSYEIFYRATDTVGNIEQQNSIVISVKQDTRPPESIAFIDEEPTINGFYNKEVEVNITATDLHSGVNKSEYSLDNGTTWLVYTSPIQLNQDGHIIVYYRSIDNSGNVEKPQKFKVSMDLIPPASPEIIFEPDEWTNSNVTAYISHGEDSGSGSEKSQYKIGNGNWIDYVTPFFISNTQTIKARTIDFAGNISEEIEAKAKIDITPPPAPLINAGDWSSEPVYVDILKEEDSESFVRFIQYQVGTDFDWTVYYDAFKVEAEGITSVRARSTDWAGNIGPESEEFVKIDYTAPANPEIILSNPNWTNEDVVFTVIDGEDALSGVQKSQYKIGNGEWIDYIAPVTVEEEGITKIYARTLDYLDHASEESVADIKIDRTPGEAPEITIRRGGLLWDKSYDTGWGLYQGKVSISAGVDERGIPLRIQYRIDSHGNWIDYAKEFTHSTGVIIYARTIDSAGNISNLDVKTLTPLTLTVGNGIMLKGDCYYLGASKNNTSTS